MCLSGLVGLVFGFVVRARCLRELSCEVLLGRVQGQPRFTVIFPMLGTSLRSPVHRRILIIIIYVFVSFPGCLNWPSPCRFQCQVFANFCFCCLILFHPSLAVPRRIPMSKQGVARTMPGPGPGDPSLRGFHMPARHCKDFRGLQ